MATSPSDLASKAGQAPDAQTQAQMPPPMNPADDNGADAIPQGQQPEAAQPLKLSDDDGDEGEGGMFGLPDQLKKFWDENKPEDQKAIADAGREASQALDDADRQQQGQPAAPQQDPADSLDFRERALLTRAGYSAADLSEIGSMSPGQRGVLLRAAERSAAPAQPQQYGPNPYLPQQPAFQPPQQGGLPGYPMQGQPQYQPQQGVPPQQPFGGQPSWQGQPYGQQPQQMPGYGQPQTNDAELARVANEMGVDVNTARQFLNLSTSQQQQYLAQRDGELAQMRQELADTRQQFESQQIDAALSTAHANIAQRYPQMQDRNAFMSYAMRPDTAALANSYRQQGLPLHDAVAAAVETMAAPSFMQQAGQNHQRQLHNAAKRSRQTSERLPSVNRAPSMPALPTGEKGVDALWEQPQLRAALGA